MGCIRLALHGATKMQPWFYVWVFFNSTGEPCSENHELGFHHFKNITFGPQWICLPLTWTLNNDIYVPEYFEG